jgi:hypothetical protein
MYNLLAEHAPACTGSPDKIEIVARTGNVRQILGNLDFVHEMFKDEKHRQSTDPPAICMSGWVIDL